MGERTVSKPRSSVLAEAVEISAKPGIPAAASMRPTHAPDSKEPSGRSIRSASRIRELSPAHTAGPAQELPPGAMRAGSGPKPNSLSVTLKRIEKSPKNGSMKTERTAGRKMDEKADDYAD